MSLSTYLPPLLGGALIGAAATLILLGLGRVAGIAGIYGGLWQRQTHDRTWRLAFVAGLLVAGLIGALVAPAAIAASPASTGMVAVAGLLVGVGTRLGSGCTSGHGVCGISRLSIRSLVATVTFIAAGVVTVALVRALGGGS